VLELEEVEGGTRVHVVETTSRFETAEWGIALELHAHAWALVA
jgi:hypothetical protein